MKANTIQRISEEKKFKILLELIADDLKIHKHFHYLSQSGLDNSLIQLRINETIFLLVGLEDEEINDTLKEWYNCMAEKVYPIDVFHDEKKLFQVASEILIELNNMCIERQPKIIRIAQ
jgi:hypothetical protein